MGAQDWGGYAPETRFVHAGQDPDPATGAVTVPLVLASTFAQDAVGTTRAGFEYARSGNPTRQAFEQALAALESPSAPASGFAFASGLAASDTLLRTVLRPGAHVVMSDDVYGGTYRLLTTSYADWGVSVTQVDATDLAAVAGALRPETALVWVETPSNPLLSVADIAGIVDLVAGHPAVVAVDNTFATPALQQPLSLGADVIVHSVTKYLAGHSDVVAGGLVIADPALAEQVGTNQNTLGAVASPFDCWLALRGLRTLGVRMRQHCDGARRVAEALTDNPRVAEVMYPGFGMGSEIAARQMTGSGGMVSFRPEGGPEAAARIAESTRVFTLAESLGGVESLIEVPAGMTHMSSAESARPVPADLVRLSVGVEDPDDLIADLRAAIG